MDDTADKTGSDFVSILIATEHRIKKSQYAQWYAKNVFDRWALRTTVVNVVGGTIISVVSAFLLAPEIAKHELLTSWMKVILLFTGGGVSAISIVQSVQRWSERAQSHFIAANAYSSLRRELEVLRLGLPASAGGLERIIGKLQNLSEISPAVPDGIWRKATRQLAREEGRNAG